MTGTYTLTGLLMAIAFTTLFAVDHMASEVNPLIVAMYMGTSFLAFFFSLFSIFFTILPQLWRNEKRTSSYSDPFDANKQLGKVSEVNSKADIFFKAVLVVLVAVAALVAQ